MSKITKVVKLCYTLKKKVETPLLYIKTVGIFIVKY